MLPRVGPLVLPRGSRLGCLRGCGANGIQIEVREDGPVNQSVFDTLTKKSLGQRRETGTPGLRDQMVPKSSGEGLCSDSLADLGCSQLGDPAPRVSDRPPESLDGLEPYQALLYGLATNPAESYLAIVVVVMPRAVLQVFIADSSPGAEFASQPWSKQPAHYPEAAGRPSLSQDICA